MTHTLAKIFGKPNDYKLCSECGYLNWYENQYCVQCPSDEFDNKSDHVQMYITDDYKFYESEGYTEEEIDNILLEV